jgi:hypothetical protein
MFDSFIYATEIDPRSCGMKHPAYDKEDIWIAQLPAIIGQPAISVLYEIHDAEGIVELWAVSLV